MYFFSLIMLSLCLRAFSLGFLPQSKDMQGVWLVCVSKCELGCLSVHVSCAPGNLSTVYSASELRGLNEYRMMQSNPT